MYAVIETGGKQYRVQPGETLRIEKLSGADGKALANGTSVTFDKVLMVSSAQTSVGKPYVSGAKVTATVVTQDRAKKVIVFKFRRRKNYRRKYGHRQPFTQVKINAIEG